MSKFRSKWFFLLLQGHLKNGVGAGFFKISIRFDFGKDPPSGFANHTYLKQD